jgi:hypothetical protein
MAAGRRAFAVLPLLAFATAAPDAACDALDVEEASLLQSSAKKIVTEAPGSDSFAATVQAMVGKMVVGDISESKEFPALQTETPFGPYPGYEGDLIVGGHVFAFPSYGGKGVRIVWSLSGTDPDCTAGAADNITNGCGIHIHVGMTCESDTGPHYFETDPDPWLPVKYISHGPSAESVGMFNADSNVLFDTNEGRAMVVHDMTGARVACALLKDLSEQL